ncbi:MAG: zinc ABC transporter substrate-binding protein [Hyphomicrobiales bacterium]|nr:zinc ABC transporter substrate-binding protein [Hyphomicrobiales bacterium]
MLTTVGAAAMAAPVRAEPTLPVVATFSILADFVRVLGGSRVAVRSLVGPNGDPHVYDPSPADAQAVKGASLLVENGLGLEGWMARLAASAHSAARVVIASQGVAKLTAEGGKLDPHAWQSVANAALYAANIRDGLIGADAAGRTTYEENAARYRAELDALDAEVRAAMAKIPPERRRIVTTHDAFAYFGAAYGLELIAPAGVSTEGEISARDLGAIIAQIRAGHIPAVFLENMSDPRIAEQIARETGAKIGGVLYTDALSPPDGPAPTYIAMMRHNIMELTKALA